REVGVGQRDGDLIVVGRDLRTEQEGTAAVQPELEPPQVPRALVIKPELALEVRGDIAMSVAHDERVFRLDEQLADGAAVGRRLDVKSDSRSLVSHWSYVEPGADVLGGIAVAQFLGEMRIAQVAPLYESVPPRLYGGTERVVSWLTEELVRRGHDVTLFAAGDSRTAARLIAPYPRGLRLDPSPPDAVALHMIELAQAFERTRDFDILHCHVDYLAFPFARLARTPTVHTLHGRLDLRHLVHLFGQFPEAPLVSISDSQRRPLASLRLNWLSTVHHGLPVDDIPWQPTAAGGYLAFLGRMSREKRPDLAIELAKAVGIPLRIAAKVDEADRKYFD